MTAFLPQSKFGTVKSERESNPIPYPEQEFPNPELISKTKLSGSAFLVTLTAPNNQSFRLNSAFMSCDQL